MRIINYILKNKLLSLFLFAYAILMLSVIDWGIPNLLHPFTYHMDEWHQLQSIRTTLKDFSANMPGSAHGTMFHFILSGLYLVPFFILNIINPFILKSSVDQLQVQHDLFEILRLNTLIFGLLSIFFIAKIAKDYLKSNQILTAILFAITPLWIALSNYFKYDIALTFWIILFIFFVFRFSVKLTLKNYLIAGVACSLAVATKISALPLIFAYIFSFFWFVGKIKKKILYLPLGLLIFSLTFLIFGIPDLVLGRGDWSEFLYSNLVIGPSIYDNLLTGFNFWWQYLLLRVFPIDFGYGFYFVYLIAISYWIILIAKGFLEKRYFAFKNELFLLFCLALFVLSLVSLGVGANGNRLLVLLPFIALLSASFLQKILSIKKHAPIIITLLLMIIAVQIYQSAIMAYVKLIPDVRQTSSQWIIKNIDKGTIIGIENIPIYQMLPDIVATEFYSKERSDNYQTKYLYKVVDAKINILPPVVIVTNKELELSFFKQSQKKLLVERLIKEKYKEVAEFKPPIIFYLFSGNYLNSYISGLVPIPTISVFEIQQEIGV